MKDTNKVAEEPRKLRQLVVIELESEKTKEAEA